VVATLLIDLVREAPFPEASDAVALACALQLLSLNGRDLEPGAPEDVKEWIERIRSGIGAEEIAAWIRQGIVRISEPRKERTVFQRRRRREAEAHLNRTSERFTDQARRSVGHAHDEAEALGHRTVAPEHLVLGMLKVPDSIGAKALTSLGVTIEAARQDLGCQPGSASPIAGGPRMEPETKWVLQLAVKEAMQLDADHIGTEHLLLALSHLPVVCGGEPGGARLLPDLGLTMGRVRKEVFRIITARPGTEVRMPIVMRS
jgi:hypothetical protein